MAGIYVNLPAPLPIAPRRSTAHVQSEPSDEERTPPALGDQLRTARDLARRLHDSRLDLLAYSIERRIEFVGVQERSASGSLLQAEIVAGSLALGAQRRR